MAPHHIYLHLGWSTHKRMPMIDEAARRCLDGLFRRCMIREGAEPLAIAILRTHVHVLIRTGPVFDLPRLVQQLKGGGSYAVNHLPNHPTGLRWNSRYFVSSVSPKALRLVTQYIERQGSRHPADAIDQQTADGSGS